MSADAMKLVAPQWWQEACREFSAAITAKPSIDDGCLVLPLDHYSEELFFSVRRSGDWESWRRLTVYHRQYWLRLVQIMQGELPLTLHRLGLDAFNQVALDFLSACPPREVELHRLTCVFPTWIRNRTSSAVSEAARLDVQMANLFIEPSHSHGIFQAPFLCWKEWHNSLDHRSLVLRGLEPKNMPLRTMIRWVIWRNHEGTLKWAKIDRKQELLLHYLWIHRDLNLACKAIADEASSATLNNLNANIAKWFMDWRKIGLFHTLATCPPTVEGTMTLRQTVNQVEVL